MSVFKITILSDFNLAHDEEDDVGDQLPLVVGAEIGMLRLRLRRSVARSRRARLVVLLLLVAMPRLRTHDAGFADFRKATKHCYRVSADLNDLLRKCKDFATFVRSRLKPV